MASRVLSGPTEALDLHLHFWEWWSTNSDAHLVSADFTEAYYGDREPAPDYVYGRMFNEIEKSVEQCVTTFVAPDVADLTEQQGRAMPPDILHEEDIPAEGLALILSTPWEYGGVYAGSPFGVVPIRAIFVRKGTVRVDNREVRSGIRIILFGDSEGVSKYIAAEGGSTWLVDRAPMFPIDLLAWAFGQPWSDSDWSDEAPATASKQDPDVGELRRKLLCLLRFMNEEIVRTERHRPPRAAQRRWERSSTNVPEDGCIVSVHLRRYAQHDQDKTDREAGDIWWSHRWWVRGHWRTNQKTGQKDIWVRPHLKPNDEHLPIVIKEKLVSVDR